MKQLPNNNKYCKVKNAQRTLLTLAHVMAVFGFWLWYKLKETSKQVHARAFSHLSLLNVSYLCVAVMDSSGEEKKTGEEVSSVIGTTEAEQREETDRHAGKATHG